MPLKMRPTGLSSGSYKDSLDYGVYCGEWCHQSTSPIVPDEKDCDMPKPVTPVKFAIADPDAVQETLCDGPFNVSATAGRATITFTHVRPKIEPLFTAGEVQPEAIVRARISFSWQNLLSLKKLLNDLIPDAPSDKPVAGSGGDATMH